MDSFLENLKQDVQCTLCNDTLTEPKILPCFDIFCKPCIERHAELISKETNVFKCPKCKSETLLQELKNAVEDLKPSVRHSKILELLEFLKSEKFCSACERQPEATWYCLDRQRLLCKDCAKTNSIINKQQQNISLNELTEADIRLLLKREDLCQDHEQVYEFFCKDCEELICIYCFNSRQCKAHETVSIAEGPLKDLLVKEEQEKLKVKQEEIQRNVERLEEIKKDGEKTKAEIEETVKQLTEMLKKCKQELDKHIDQEIEEAERKSKKAQEELVRIGKASDYFDELKKIGVVSEIREATQTMEVYRHDSKTAAVTSNIHEGLRFKFVISNDCFRFLHSKHGLGSLEQVDRTTAIHVEPELEAWKETKLTLTNTPHQRQEESVSTSDVAVAPVSLKHESKEGEKHSENGEKKDEEIRNNAVDERQATEGSKETSDISVTKTAGEKLIISDAVRVKISPEENVKIKQKVKADGTIEVEFMANVAGQLTAEVQVNGIHVSNSPLVMNVLPQQMRITGEFDTKRLTRRCRFAGIAVNEDNNRMAVTEWSTHGVHVFNTGDLSAQYGGEGSGDTQLHYPQGLAFLNETDLVIADCNNDRICIVNTTTGTLVKTFGNHGSGDGEFDEPHGVHVDDDRNIIVCDHDNHRVQVFTRDGDFQYQFCLQNVEHFSPIAVQKIQDQYYVSDFSNNVIHVFEKKGSVVTRVSTIGEEGSADGQLRGPCGLAIDNDHNLLVCDRGNNRIQKFTLDGRLVGKTYDEIDKPYLIAAGKDGMVASTESKILIVK